jgi:hypothetical protein
MVPDVLWSWSVVRVTRPTASNSVVPSDCQPVPVPLIDQVSDASPLVVSASATP